MGDLTVRLVKSGRTSKVLGRRKSIISTWWQTAQAEMSTLLRLLQSLRVPSKWEKSKLLYRGFVNWRAAADRSFQGMIDCVAKWKETLNDDANIKYWAISLKNILLQPLLSLKNQPNDDLAVRLTFTFANRYWTWFIIHCFCSSATECLFCFFEIHFTVSSNLSIGNTVYQSPREPAITWSEHRFAGGNWSFHESFEPLGGTECEDVEVAGN